MATEHHLKTPRSARYFTLGDTATAPAEIWVVCHGYGQLAERFVQRFEALDDGSRLVVAPEALSRFYVAGSGLEPDSRVGASWMTREDRLLEMEDYIGYLDAVCGEVRARLGASNAKLVALGFSQGTATAARWAMRGRSGVDRLVLWAGLLPPDVEPAVEAARLSALGLTLVAGETDDYVMKGLEAQKAALEGAGVRYRLVTFKGGHSIEAAALRELTGR